MRIHRHIGFWIINVYVPMFIISMTLFASYMLPISETADRLAASLTLMLAMVTFKYVISDRLPHISYLTYIDRYMLACFILAFVIVFMQSLAMGGIVNEPSLTWLTQADINASSTTTDDDVSDSGWLATATVTWAFSSPRIARSVISATASPTPAALASSSLKKSVRNPSVSVRSSASKPVDGGWLSNAS